MAKCVKCHQKFEEKDSIMVCGKCGAMYHKDCWFASPMCITSNCNYDRGMPLRGENIDLDMDENYMEEMLKKANSKETKIKKIIPIIIAVVIFAVWIGLNSYNNYQKEHQNKNVITFTEKK